MGSVNAVPRMSAAATTRTDRASHGLPGERVLADRGRIRELADDGPVRIHEPAIALAACGSACENTIRCRRGRRPGRTQTSRTYPSACEGSTHRIPTTRW